MQRQLYYSDNLPVLQSMPDESIDLIYLDPPFNSKKAYNIIYPDDLGQVQAFDDTWTWTPQCDAYLHDLQQSTYGGGGDLVGALIEALGKTQLCAYLVNMAVRLVELHRVLRSTGSLYLHCDPTASHYLKVVLDRIFGQRNFRRELIWHLKGAAGFKAKGLNWVRGHDVILYYVKRVGSSTFNKIWLPYTDEQLKRFSVREDGRRYKSITKTRGIYLDESLGVPATSVWSDIAGFQTIVNSPERLGYPTQKPLALLERIIQASSNEGDTVLDPFCGCGTTVAAAEMLRRHWIGIDITYSSIAAIRERFKRDRVDIWKQIEILDSPTTVQQVDEKLLNQASPLFARKEFEKFCVATIGGLPNDKMGADGGIDGRIPLMSKSERAICSVKSGHVSVEQIRSLKGLLNQRDVAGVFISRHVPTKPMQDFANQAGLHTPKRETLLEFDPFPRLQILTLEEILNGKRPNLPYAKAA